MGENNQSTKKPLSESIIFRNMMIAVFAVASLFFVKNLIGQAWKGAVAIGLCLIIFTVVVITMKKINLDQNRQQLVLCVSLVFLVFFISINSGNFYSDDFPLYLAVVGLSGLYLVPKYTLVQIVLIDIIFALMYIIHPEKADPLSQYIMCMVLFSVAAYTFYMVIKRGRAYIEISRERAEEAERLLAELKNAGEELKSSCGTSLSRITKLEEANQSLENSASALRADSENITQEAVEVAVTFEDVHGRMSVTESQLDTLNSDVKLIEVSLAANKKSMKEMTVEMEALKSTVSETGTVFGTLQEQIIEISEAAEQLTKIASSTTMLALNASIEAARAGQSGAGFAVVASKVQDLAEDSNNCAAQVASIVQNMQQRIDETTRQLSGSTNAINLSINSLIGFQQGFDQLTEQFGTLYQNIEEQNTNVHQMDSILEDLSSKISNMSTSSEASQNSVAAIADTINIYKDNIDMVINDNKIINELSASMLELSNTKMSID